MSWQTPGGDPPPDPAAPTSPVPVTPSAAPLVPEPAPESTPTTPAQGLISAAPVGWAAPDQPTAGGPTDGPEVSWAPPAPRAAVSMGEGLVIAGVFSRVVGYAIDTAFLGTLYFILLAALGAYDGGRLSTGYIAVNILLLAVEALYFVGLWRSGWHATLGMRLMGLRVLRAIDGGALTLNSAAIRWLAVLGIPTILGFLPVFGALAQLLWVLALLLTTAMQPLRQGLHDRWAGSVVVQPAPGGSGAAVVGCLVLIALIFILPIVLLIMLGGQIQDLLSTVGTSI